MSKKATEEQFEALHNLVTAELTSRLQAGEECTTADIKAAIDWLSKNNITGVATSNNHLGSLLNAIMEVDEEDVARTTGV